MSIVPSIGLSSLFLVEGLRLNDLGLHQSRQLQNLYPDLPSFMGNANVLAGVYILPYGHFLIV